MNPVEIYHNISQTQSSSVRRYGGLKVNGVEYLYVAENDTLVLEDIRKKMIKQYKEQQRLGKELERAKHEFMF